MKRTGEAGRKPAQGDGVRAYAPPAAILLIVLAAGYAYAEYGSEIPLLAIPLASIILRKERGATTLVSALFMLALLGAGTALFLGSGLSGPLGVLSFALLASLAALAAISAEAGKAGGAGGGRGPLVPLWAVLALFAALAVLLSYKALLSGGIYIYRDEWAVPDLQFFRDYFLQIMKHGTPALDTQKRIVEGWMHFFIDFDLMGRVQFAALAFASLASSFFVFERILAGEAGGGPSPARARVIAAAGAFFYVVNPLDTQIFPSYYPSIDYALFPVLFYLLYRSFAKGDLRSALLSGLLAGFMFLMVIHTLIYLPIAFLAVGAVAARRWAAAPKKLLVGLAVFGLAALSAVMFIILPSLAISARTVITDPNPLNVEMLGLFSKAASLPGPMLMDYRVFWWPYVPYDYPLGNLFYPLSALFCGALLVYASRSGREWAAMSLVALAAVFFLAKGSEPPFGSVYQWINFSLPLGWLIRVPMKFNHIAPFFFGVLFVLFAARLGRHPDRRVYLFIAAAVVFLSAFSWPFFTGDMAGVLSKKDFSGWLPDIHSVNAILSQNHPPILSMARLNDVIDSDTLPPNTLAWDEAAFMNSSGNWSAMPALAGRLGVQYLLLDSPDAARASGISPAYSGSMYSLFLLKDDPSPFSVSRSAYLCYCSVAAAESLISDPPSGAPPPVMEIPYSAPSFPQGFAAASDTAVLDSSRLVVPDPSGAILVPFYRGTESIDSRSGWGRAESDYGDQGREYFDFGQGFVASEAAGYGSAVMSDGPPIGLGDLAFSVSANSTYSSGSFGFAPGGGLAVSSLPLTGPAEYSVSFSASGEGPGNVSAYILSRNSEGRAISVVPLLDGGSIDADRSFNMTVPEGAVDSMLYVESSPSAGGRRLDVRDLEIQRLTREPDGPSISSGFQVPESGDYDIYLRVLESRDGGTLGAELDGARLPAVQTDAGGQRMSWERLYSGPLSAGGHSLTLVQGGGKNLVNVALVERSGTDGMDSLAGKTLIYRLLGWSDFYSFGGSEGTGESMAIRNPATASVYIFSPGEYSVSADIRGNASVAIDGAPAAGRENLSLGWHRMTVTPLESHVSLRSVTLAKEAPGTPLPPPAILGYSRTDPSAYNVTVSSGGGPFFLVFGREFSPSWTAAVDGAVHRPVSSYEAVDAYLLDFTGTKTITLSFEPQGYMYAGAALGALGIAALALFVRRSEKINK